MLEQMNCWNQHPWTVGTNTNKLLEPTPTNCWNQHQRTVGTNTHELLEPTPKNCWNQHPRTVGTNTRKLLEWMNCWIQHSRTVGTNKLLDPTGTNCWIRQTVGSNTLTYRHAFFTPSWKLWGEDGGMPRDDDLQTNCWIQQFVGISPNTLVRTVGTNSSLEWCHWWMTSFGYYCWIQYDIESNDNGHIGMLACDSKLKTFLSVRFFKKGCTSFGPGIDYSTVQSSVEHVYSIFLVHWISTTRTYTVK